MTPKPLYSPITLVFALVTMTLALGCSDDAPTAPRAPDGPFVELILPDVIDTMGPNVLGVRAGIREDGSVTYAQGADVVVQLTEGFADSPDGITDAEGRYSTTVSVDPESENQVRGSVIVDFPGGDAIIRQFARVRGNSIAVENRDIRLSVSSEFGYKKEPNSEVIMAWDDTERIDEADFGGPFNEVATLDRAESVEKMNVVSTGSVGLDTSTGASDDGTIVIGATFRTSARVTVTDPEPGFVAYDANCYTFGSVKMTVYVWGDEAELSLVASTDQVSHYMLVYNDIADVAVFGCSYEADNPQSEPLCGYDQYSATLSPGRYLVVLSVSAETRIGNEVDQMSGTDEDSGSATFEFTLSRPE